MEYSDICNVLCNNYSNLSNTTQPSFSCSKLTIETLEQRFEICSKLTIKTPKRRRRRFGVFIVNFEHISHLCSSVSIVNFERVNAGWGYLIIALRFLIKRFLNLIFFSISYSLLYHLPYDIIYCIIFTVSPIP